MAATLFGSVSVDESKSITENLKRYIVDNKQLEISARDWAEFNKAYSKEDLREAIRKDRYLQGQVRGRQGRKPRKG